MIFQYVLPPDQTETLAYVSDGCWDVFELDPKAIQANANLMFDLVYFDDQPHLHATIAYSIQTLTKRTWEGRMMTPSGQQKWIHEVA